MTESGTGASRDGFARSADPYGRDEGKSVQGDRGHDEETDQQDAEADEEPAEEGDIAAMMGFGGFGTTKVRTCLI